MIELALDDNDPKAAMIIAILQHRSVSNAKEDDLSLNSIAALEVMAECEEAVEQVRALPSLCAWRSLCPAFDRFVLQLTQRLCNTPGGNPRN